MRVKRTVSFLLVFGLGCLTGIAIGHRLGKKAAAAAEPQSHQPSAEVLRENLENELWQRKRAEREQAVERLKKLSGNWISADGQKRAKLDYAILEFSKTLDWPDLEGRGFLLGEDHYAFLTESGHYVVRTFNDRPDALIFIKQDRKTGSLSHLTLYREGSPHAASRPPLPETPPPPMIQALLDLVPGMDEHESVSGVNQRIAEVWLGKMDLINGSSSLGQSDYEIDLNVDDQWILQRSENREGRLIDFRIVRTWVKDRRAGQDPDVERVVYPYYEFGKIVTGPMQSRPSTEVHEGDAPPVKEAE